MHIPDGFIDGPTSAGAALVAAGGARPRARRAGQVLDERRVPLAGLTAAFIFAAQMLNFPVAGGTSGHLLGGALAAILVGPSVGAVCVSVVLLVQALLFADGGLSALGLNIVNMALLGAFGGYAAFAVIRRVASTEPTTRAVMMPSPTPTSAWTPTMAETTVATEAPPVPPTAYSTANATAASTTEAPAANPDATTTPAWLRGTTRRSTAKAA